MGALCANGRDQSQLCKRNLDDYFCLGPGDQDTPVHQQVELTKGPVAEDVLHGLARFPTPQHGKEGLSGNGRHGLVQRRRPGAPRCILHEPLGGPGVPKTLDSLLVKGPPGNPYGAVGHGSGRILSPELTTALVSKQGIDYLVELAHQHLVEIVKS
jgi:hypothetical protein